MLDGRPVQRIIRIVQKKRRTQEREKSPYSQRKKSANTLIKQKTGNTQNESPTSCLHYGFKSKVFKKGIGNQPVLGSDEV